MPAVIIRMMDALASIMEQTTSAEQRRTLARQAHMIFQSATETVPEANDREDIDLRFQRILRRIAIDDAEDV
jgi:uncharacterized membrane protein